MTEWFGHVAARPALYAIGTKPGILPVSAHTGCDRTRASRFAAQQKSITELAISCVHGPMTSA